MFKVRCLSSTAVMLVAAAAVSPALAKECKTEPVIQAGEPNVLRSVGAYPSSLVAWRQAVRAKFGNGWENWSSADDRKIECDQKAMNGSKRWVCTRSARPCNTSLAGPLSGEVLTARLKRGDQGDQVTLLQTILKSKNYDVTVDGNFGRGTETAVQSYQRKEGLTPDGIVGTETRARLNAGRTAAATPPAGSATVGRKLRRGDQGDDVRLVQEKLKQRGFDVAVDGNYGSGTQSAVRAFQRREGLNADGVVGDLTRQKLGV